MRRRGDSDAVGEAIFNVGNTVTGGKRIPQEGEAAFPGNDAGGIIAEAVTKTRVVQLPMAMKPAEGSPGEAPRVGRIIEEPIVSLGDSESERGEEKEDDEVAPYHHELAFWSAGTFGPAHQPKQEGTRQERQKQARRIGYDIAKIVEGGHA